MACIVLSIMNEFHRRCVAKTEINVSGRKWARERGWGPKVVRRLENYCAILIVVVAGNR